MDQTATTTIGVWGQFDIDSFAQQVRLRVLRHALAQRIPTATFRVFAPFGSARPISVAATEAVEPLTPVTPVHTATILEELDLLITCATDLRADAYADHPIQDPADVSAALDLIADPSAQTSLHLPHEHDAACHHPALFARRLWSYAMCEQRRDFLRAMHWWPQRGTAIVVDGVGMADDELGKLLRSIDTDQAVVVFAPMSLDAASIRADIDGHLNVHILPLAAASLEDRIAAIAGAASVVSHDLAIHAACRAYGRVVRDQLPGSPEAFAIDCDELDSHYDRIAQRVVTKPRAHVATAETDALRATLRASKDRTTHERVVFANYTRALRNQVDAQAAQLSDATRPGVVQRIARQLRRQR